MWHPNKGTNPKHQLSYFAKFINLLWRGIILLSGTGAGA